MDKVLQDLDASPAGRRPERLVALLSLSSLGMALEQSPVHESVALSQQRCSFALYPDAAATPAGATSPRSPGSSSRRDSFGLMPAQTTALFEPWPWELNILESFVAGASTPLSVRRTFSSSAPLRLALSAASARASAWTIHCATR